MAFSTEIDLTALAVTTDRLNELQKLLKRPRPLLTAIGLKNVEQTRRRFDTATAPNGSAWKPTSEFSLSSRPGGGGGGKTLQDRGLLKKSIRVTQVRASSVIVGSPLIYSRIHHEGGTIRPRNAKNLAIPRTTAARRTSARNYMKRNKGARFLFNKKRKPWAIANKSGKIQYILTKKVEIPRRPFLGMSTRDFREIDSLVTDIARKVAAK